MNRRIVERERELDELTAAVRLAASGSGSVVLISGEAGIGKSRLVEAMAAWMPPEGRTLVGHCDDLQTARTLGPFRDLADKVSAGLATELEIGTDRDRLLTALLAELRDSRRPTLLAVEDIHWADEATLDVLRYLVRRIEQLPVVLMLTYRDDDLSLGPLLHFLGVTGGSDVCRRLPLNRLTPDGVAELAANSSLDAAAVFAATAGNPFFVSEVLASGTATEVPSTVVDSVRDRLQRLSPEVHSAVQQLAVVPTVIDRWLLDEIVVGGIRALADAEEAGLLEVTPRRVSFRHELTRRAIADSLPVVRYMELNQNVLTALVARSDADVARIVHHAVAAGDQQAIVRFAPAAARDAASGGAHRQAVAHYQAALLYADAFPPIERSQLLQEYAIESYTIGASDEAVAAQRRAIDLRRSLGDHVAVGEGLRWLSRMHWWGGDRLTAEQVAEEAIGVLEPLGPSRSLARAYSNQAQLDILAYNPTKAMPTAERAVAMSRQTEDPATLAHALTNLGASLWQLGMPDSMQTLEEGLQVALDVGAKEDACRIYVNIAWNLLDQFRAADAEQFITAGLELAERAEQFGWLDMLHVLRAVAETSRGRWSEAVRSAEQAVGAQTLFRCPALVTLGRIKTRTGDPTAGELLASALELSHRIGEQLWIGHAAAAAAEEAWLRGDAAAVIDIAAAPYAQARQRRIRTGWPWPELGYWLTKAGHEVAAPETDSPFDLLTSGRWREAADRWRTAGYRYEYALALTESPDPADLLEALDVLGSINATSLAKVTRRLLREQGATTIPRGRALTSRQNPAGLTARQLEVLRLLNQGLTDAEIADRLVVSVRTASNHVAAVLARLGVHTRSEAVEQARVWLEP
ncbi:AAA family ATPase [Kribbella albertanoniae]|uniref:Helix-turn-helix transcriptional regulator n=1 Tax=Kribbella albertanoniae TaxID=1266829 RepID=A0A4R4QG56_9ACTN|nr:AAA family ATPase [Kribbella albertanoniae]TDC34656.1 helix-turn-helix transcriptional regulator [Kribbella albertanoniae]